MTIKIFSKDYATPTTALLSLAEVKHCYNAILEYLKYYNAIERVPKEVVRTAGKLKQIIKMRVRIT